MAFALPRASTTAAVSASWYAPLESDTVKARPYVLVAPAAIASVITFPTVSISRTVMHKVFRMEYPTSSAGDLS